MKTLKQEFRSWLRSKDPAEIVGITDDELQWPIARFTKETTGVKRVSGADEIDF